MIKQRTLWTLLAGTALIGAGACKEKPDTGAVTTRTPEGVSSTPSAETADRRNVAMVRVINAIPGGDAVTIWAGDSVAFATVPYKTTSDWRQVPDDRFNFQIKNKAGTEAVAQNRENLQGGRHYTIVALPDDDDDNTDERTLRVLDDDLKPVPADKARIRFINGTPDDLEVDLLISGREERLFDGINFSHEGGWSEVLPIAGTVTARPENKKTILASLENVTLEGGKSYTFVLAGTTNKYELLKVEDSVAPKWEATETRGRVEAP